MERRHVEIVRALGKRKAGMTRDEVAAAIQKLGAKLNRGVSKTMDIFVTGNKPGPSKLKQVMQWRSEGLQIEIIDQIRIKEIIDKYLFEW